MIGVDLIGQIRRAFHDQGRGIKTIAREFSVSRTTVRKIVRGDETEFRYERGVQPAPKLGAYVEELTRILESEQRFPVGNGARHNVFSRNCAVAAMRAPTTAFIGLPGHGGRSALVSRQKRMCR